MSPPLFGWLLMARREQYGFDSQPRVTTQYRVGIEGSYQLSLFPRHLVLWGRLEYATLDQPSTTRQQNFLMLLSARWRL